MKYGFLFKTALAVVILLGISIFFGCKKEYPEPPVDYLPQDFKDWMFFKEGTYWVYQDSVSGILDSTVVTRTESEIYKQDKDRGKDTEGERVYKQVERLSYYTYSFDTGKEYKFMSKDYCPSKPDYQSGHRLDLIRYRMHDDIPTNSLALLFYNKPVPYQSSYVRLTAKYDSLQIGNRYYKDVVLNWQTANNSGGGVESWIYLAKGIGIVQIRERNRGQLTTQKLVRYHIEQ